MNMGRFCR